MSTKKKIKKLEFLCRYAAKHLDSFRKKYSENIVGIHVGKKKRGKKTLRYYSLVFHVRQKMEDPEVKIPKYISIRIPGEGQKRIRTDVVETGEFYLTSVQPGTRIASNGSDEFGTISCFLRKGNSLYACSNMHVLAPRLLASGETSYFKSIANQTTMNVTLKSGNYSCGAYLEKAIYNGIDAAIARIDPTAQIIQLIPGIGNILGASVVNYSNYANLPVRMHGAVSGLQSGKVRSVGIHKPTSIPGISLNNLIGINMHTQRGDSGAPIVDRNNRIVGILVGRDTANNIAYAIPILPILNYFQTQLAL